MHTYLDTQIFFSKSPLGSLIKKGGGGVNKRKLLLIPFGGGEGANNKKGKGVGAKMF